MFFKNRNAVVDPDRRFHNADPKDPRSNDLASGPVDGFVEVTTTYLVGGGTSTSNGVFAATDYINSNTRTSINSPPIRNSHGLLPMRTYSRVVDRVTSDAITVEDTKTTLPRVSLSTTLYRIKGSPPIPSSISARSIAVNRCLARLKDMSVNLGAAIGEGGQTISLLLTAVRRLATSRKFVARSFDAYRKLAQLELRALSASGDKLTRIQSQIEKTRSLYRGNLSSSVRALGSQGKNINLTQLSLKKPTSISGLWLELQYGWLPLIQDVHDLVGHFEKTQRVGLIRVSGSSSEQSNKISSAGTTGLYSLPHKSYGESSTHCRCVIFAELDNKFLQQAAQLGLTNPASIAWELTPYSFIVDWFLPIGKFLDNLDAWFGYAFISGCITTRVSATSSTVVSDTTSKRVLGSRAVSRQYYSKSREVLTGFPMPGIPVFKNPVSTKHFLNALALLAQHSRRP